MDTSLSASESTETSPDAKLLGPVSFALPRPWTGGTFQFQTFGSLTYFVGPNGSGKSRFAEALKAVVPNARLLGTDRLEGQGRGAGFGLWGDNFSAGLSKQYFDHFKNAGRSQGAGIDTFVILEERPDIRVLVEATVSSLFKRTIRLEWDSGNLVPKAISQATGETYRADRDECHGIRELIVLLTQLYDDQHDCLIIDEPELNLHPQFQSFFMQEVRQVADGGRGLARRKAIILITHSPFILDIKTVEDLQSIYSFSGKHELPANAGVLDHQASVRLRTLVPRLNVHHKQLFFADDPIFVEGITDAQLIEAIQEKRNVSVAAAGSCIIDAGGCEEVTKYLELCKLLGKRAHFVYDLDSLFTGNLRACIRNDDEVSEFLADLGLGGDFTKVCGELDRGLTDAIKVILALNTVPQGIQSLSDYLNGVDKGARLFIDKKALNQARVALLVEMAANRPAVTEVIGKTAAAELSGRLSKVKEALATKRVRILTGGALEHFLPLFDGDRYRLQDSAKSRAVTAELVALPTLPASSLAGRYGELFEAITELPAAMPVDLDAVLKEYLGDYVHSLQGHIVKNPEWRAEELNRQMASASSNLGKLFKVTDFSRTGNEFSGVLTIAGDGRTATISHRTNAGMRDFELSEAQSSR